tara:strand:- start:203 stop:511 length:309 start_codon:yes stop_codon:yes gene_type:complete
MKEIIHFLIATGVAYVLGYYNAKNKYIEKEWDTEAEEIIKKCDEGFLPSEPGEGLEGWYQRARRMSAAAPACTGWNTVRGRHILNYIRVEIWKRQREEEKNK